MVIYEVNLAVAPSVEESYRTWLRAHIHEILELEGFQSARWFQPEPPVREDGWVLHTVQYELASRDALQVYFDSHADRIRSDGLERVGDDFSATRRILGEVIPVYGQTIFKPGRMFKAR